MSDLPVVSSDHGVGEILSFLAISDRVGTAGQPTRDQFAAIREAGYEVVVNLAMPSSTGALADEAELVAAEGMVYVHIPVVWGNPTSGDLGCFFEVMDRYLDRKVFVHCAMNMRVSAFMFLYQVIREGVPLLAAWQTMLKIWKPDATWERFIRQELARYGKAS